MPTVFIIIGDSCLHEPQDLYDVPPLLEYHSMPPLLAMPLGVPLSVLPMRSHSALVDDAAIIALRASIFRR